MNIRRLNADSYVVMAPGRLRDAKKVRIALRLRREPTMTFEMSKPVPVSVAVAIGVYLGSSLAALGWGDTGHQVVAMGAWNLLSPSERQWAVELLKHHPRYNQEFAKAVPPGASDEERVLWTFEYGAIWPDYIYPVRATEPAFFAKYQHSSWHVINEPLLLDPTNPVLLPTPHPATNASAFSVKEALPNAIAQLTDRRLSAEERAVALCWVMHMVGDLHQPCHSTTLFSRRFPGPEGDHVATKLRVETPDGLKATMHHVWDDGLGTNNDLSTLKGITQKLEKDPTLHSDQLHELRDHASIASWIAESHDCAVRYVYTPEVRETIMAQEAEPKAAFKPVPLGESYMAKMREVCQKRGALAGFRLANILHQSAAAE